jgi:protein TonB
VRRAPVSATAAGSAAPAAAEGPTEPRVGGGGPGGSGGSAARGARGAGPLPRIRHRPAPAYPLRARRAGHEGRSEIELRIGRDGRVREARLHRSAGDPALDEAALAAVRRWRFAPSPAGVDWTSTWFLVPIEFRLE